MILFASTSGRGTLDHICLANHMSLTATIKSNQNEKRKDDGVDGDAQRISQTTWRLFLRIYDFKDEEWEFTNMLYQSAIPDELKWRNGGDDFEGMTGVGLVNSVNNRLFPG